MRDYNNIILTAKNATGIIPNSGLDLVQDVTFNLIYPGGLCVSMTFLVARDPVALWPVSLGDKIEARNGARLVWEGIITGITPTSYGLEVEAAGYWGYYLMAQKTRKIWADTRVGDDAWPELTTSSGYGLYSLDRQNRLLITPRSTRDAAGAENGWALNAAAALVYTAPVGQTMKRITFNYDLQEGAQAWRLALETTGGTVLWNVDATGTGSVDHTFATPAQAHRLIFRSMAAQNPPSDNTVYGKFTDVTVYTETGSINAQEIAKDIRAMVAQFSTDETHIGALTLSLVPFGAIDNGPVTLADFLTQAAGYGDASYNRWACYLDLSDNAADGKPVVALEQVTALTDYDYILRMDEVNLSGDISFRQDGAAIRNWIAIEYQDENGRAVYLTPDDDATLTDSTSVTAYGRRDEWITLPTTSATTAANYARRYLAQYKDPQWAAVGTVSVMGYIRTKTSIVPACEIRPGMRLRIDNWLNDISGVGLTFAITAVTYNDVDETASLEIGIPDTEQARLLQLERLSRQR